MINLFNIVFLMIIFDVFVFFCPGDSVPSG